MSKPDLKTETNAIKGLYLTHTDWDWILQRPQILAQFLDTKFDLDVVCVGRLLRKESRKVVNTRPSSLRHLSLFPKQYVLKPLLFLNKIILNLYLGDLNKYHFIWVTYPEFIDYIPSSFHGLIVYDCMDNYEALSPLKSKEGLHESEKKMLARADIVFASSRYLLERIKTFKSNAEVFLLRNGFLPCDYKSPIKCDCKDSYVISYFGTIAQWMDVASLARLVQHNKSVTVDLIGPLEIEKSSLGSLTWTPPVDHSHLEEKALRSDCLIMPFLVNEVTEAVDPVKLYEYISFGKCIVSVYYKEIERFKDFVYFYSSGDDLLDLVDDLSKKGFPPKYSEDEQKTFLANNTWEKRADFAIEKIVTSLNCR